MMNANTAVVGPACAAGRSSPRAARTCCGWRVGGGSGQRSGVGHAAAVDDAPPPRGAEPHVLAGIRADEHAASPSRMRGIQWRSSACGRHAAKRRCIALGDAFAYRCGGSTGWLDCGAGRLPVSRLTARAGTARASTKTRASVGGGAGSVKAKRAATAPAARPRHRAWRACDARVAGSRGPGAVLSYAPRSVLACALRARS